MPSRAGNVIVAPGPVTTIYENPTERVLFWPERDANPFFHFFEGLHFLAGRNDVAFLKQFIRNYSRFSDDGVTLTGAYGYRWRKHFAFDQIERLITLFKAYPNTRRGVLQMWDPTCDLREDESGADLPCNTQVLFGTTYGKRDEPNRLNMTVINRSNDILYGLYGANAVHMSMLQEYLAVKLGLMVGTMTTLSNNFHAYEDVYIKVYLGDLRGWRHETTQCSAVISYPMITNPDTWDRDLTLFFEDPASYGFDNPFFQQVVVPMWFAHKAYKKKDISGALEIIQQCQASDWRRAATEWLQRRVK
jgi:hypothetical protein